jgi:hypothetical protein
VPVVQLRQKEALVQSRQGGAQAVHVLLPLEVVW